MSYGYGKHKGRIWKKKTVDKFKEMLPRLLLSFAIIFILGVILMILGI